ncbi:MAG: hypothetical protein A2X49_11230 [Lentisphaerae bacterium GWF2_52_8]|nr:MAG: hypothetical protein A2X49_11230 [Lentisphaerae bacterium GWF2_52_8]
MGLNLNAKQRLGWGMLTDPSKTRILFDGGSRSGKTILITEFLVARAFQYPGSRQLMARRCLAHARQSLWCDTLRKYLSKYIPPRLYKLQESQLIVEFRNGSSICIGGLDDAERVEKILGNEYLTVFLNEATQLSWPTVQMAMTRLAQLVFDAGGGRGIPKLILDCNPRGPRHWLHLLGVKNILPDTGEPLPDASRWGRLHWSAFDNKENLPQDYIATLEALPETMRARMLHGLWRENDGAVYDEFNEDMHVIAPFEIAQDWRRVRAIDFGFTNPFVCLWGALDHDGRLYLYREHYQAGVRVSVHAKTLGELTGQERIEWSVADHDAGERAELESAGIRTSCASKNVREGIQAVKRMLAPAGDGKPRLFFFDTLKNLLSEIGEYSWGPASDASNAKEEPRKFNDHAMDALRYMVMSIGRHKAVASPKMASCRNNDGRW